MQSAPWSNGNKQTKNKGKERKKNTFSFKLLTFIFKTTTLTFRLLLYKLQSQLLMIFLKNSRRGSLALKEKTFQRQTASLAVSLNASFLALNFTQLHSVSFGFIRLISASLSILRSSSSPWNLMTITILSSFH